MRKSRRNKIISYVLLVASLLTLVGCQTTSNEQAFLQYLDYGTGMDEADNYNSELYALNTSDVQGADPGCIYVSKEENPAYGGYYYMYVTSNAQEGSNSLQAPEYKDNNVKAVAYRCYRSTDLIGWEECGALDGYSMVVYKEDWCDNHYWAPEVIYNRADGKYYMYFSASYAEGWEGRDLSTSTNAYDRLSLGVAVSDAPTGPFTVLYDVDPTSGNRVPTINFKRGCQTEYPWAAIDVSPFFDDNGDLYLYFNKHEDDHYTHLNGSWGMKMKTMTQPDYSTVACLTIAGKTTVSSVPGKIEEVTEGSNYMRSEGINEGPTMLKENGIYYLTYSSEGYKSISYSVHQAISTDPLSGFVKLNAQQGNPVMDGSIHGTLHGTAHHCFVRNGEEIWIMYHRHETNFGWEGSWGRAVCSDRVNFVTNAEGTKVLTANGPSNTLQWLPEEISGYKNLAKTAKVTISNGTGVEYINDTVLPYYDVAAGMVMHSEGDVKITLKWDEPVDVTSLMIYNSASAETAFSKIKDIRFRVDDTEDGRKSYKVIKDLLYPKQGYDKETDTFVACVPAVAEFDTFATTEIQITIAGNDRILDTNKQGEANVSLDLSEIVVLGGKTNE